MRLADQAQAVRSGLTGVLLSVNRTAAGSSGFTVSLDYHGFRNAAGAGFGDRARLVSLPACALSTPSLPTCQVQTPVPYQNDTRHQTLSTTVVPASAGVLRSAAASQPNRAQPARLASNAGATMVLAAVAGADGSGGAFSASSLAPSGSWSVSGASGSFHWGYPIAVPPAAAGSDVAPSVSLAYNSGSVDGHIASTNNQPSWLGEGWDYAPGYIERTYRSCSSDTTLPAASQTGDACWAGQILTMSLGGSSTALVLDDTSHTWHAQTDADQRVELIGAGSGGYQGEYWRVTTADGVQYYFGRNTLPGGSAATATKSVYTEPVFGPHSTDPCYNAAGFAQSSCTQAWRWNLDYVVDPHANATAYYYTPESNYYGAHNATTPVSYLRGGYLREIDYGLRDAGGSTGIYGSQPPDRVTFTVAERCIPVAGFTCDPSLFTAANASHWPDTPQDQQCASTGTCNNHTPTFWSTKRLTAITTGYWTGTGTTYQTVDSYVLGQSFPTDGDPSQSLDSITRTGYSGATTLALPAVTFASQLMDNRVSGYNGQSVMQQHRLTTIHSETGQITSISYNQPGRAKPTCTAATVPSDESNDTAECFPVRWVPPFNTNPILDYFHKYVVTEVDLQDPNAIAPTRKTTYSYLGDPAWHYDDNEVIKPANRTWGQFRGYQQVQVRTGNESAASNGTADQWTLTTTTYYRGMNGDTLPGGGSRTASVTDTHGGSVPDDNNFADMAREVQTFNGDGGAEVSDTVTTPITVATTATRARTGLPALTAHIVAGAHSQVYTAIAAGGWQEHDSDSSYDSIGRLVGQTDSGTGLSPVCTATSYADNSTSWIRDLVAEKIVSGQACPTSGQPSPILADSRAYYDSSTTLGAVPGAGDTTTTLVATDHASPPTAWAKSIAGFDTTGRQTSATSYISAGDTTGRLTSTSYTLTAAGQLASVKVTNPASQATSTVVEPGRGLITEVVDVAVHKVDASYDPLGRVTSVWQPGQVKGTDPASTTYSYLVRSTGPLTVTTKTLIDVGNSMTPAYKTSVNLFDAFGSLRQTQVDAPGGGRVVVDSFDDSHGWVVMTNNRWYTSGVPGTDLVTTADSAVDDRTVSNFDGAGRPLLVTAYRGTTAISSIQTVYGGDRTTTIPPTGGVETTAVFDARGETVESDQWTSAPTFAGNVLSGGTASRTTYHFTPTGLQDQLTSAAGTLLAATWTASYDLAGRPYHKSDPDAGASDLSYYDTGELKTSTDANNQTVTYNYDGLGRKVSAYLGSNEVASWLYDTLQAGQQTSSTRYTSSGNYVVASTGYDNYGNPLGVSVQLPPSETGFASSYTTSYSWTSTHLMATMKPADGGSLPSETIKYTYDALGNPTATAGYNSYVSATSWSPFSEPNQYKLGTNVQLASLTYTRDPQTHRVLSTDLSAQTAIPQQEHTVYSYDPAGNITQTADTEGGGSGVPVQTQCYRYSSLDQLGESWAATDGCTADPATAGNATVGGPQPYWTSWTFDATGGRLQQVQHALPGSGTGDSTTNYTNGLTGHAHALASATITGPGAGTSSFGYDADGNTNLRTLPAGAQTIGYTYDGHTDTVAGPAGSTDYRYDADGNQLVRHDPSSTTVYLPGEELTRNTSTGTIVGTRYYSHNGTVVSVRVGHGNQSYLYANQTGSNQVSLPTTSTGTGTPVRQYLDPFGSPLGTVTGGSWPDQHGFLNKPQDAVTGLTDVGSRQYDPVLGRFTAVDPVLDLKQPQQANGYSYALNNPVSNSDPTGMDPPPIGCENTACYNCLYADIDCGQMKQAPPPPGSGGGGGGGSTSKPAASPLPKIPPDRLKVLRADIQMYMKDSPNDWNVPGSYAYNALMVRIRWAIYGPLTFDDILKAAKGPAVAFVVGIVGAALCPESAGAGCLVAVGALAGAAGACASDCSNVTSVALSAVAGAIVGAAGGAGGGGPGLETGADQAVFWSGIKGSDAGAAAWVGKNGGVTLETTLDQRNITLPEYDRNDPSVVGAWRQASAAFARGAQGNVIVLQGDAVRTTSVWAEVEYPALTANPNVTSITAINPETGGSTLLWSR
ncbi:MAG: type IV secretion protein Rhs [Actinomycetota bacterium]|nr:type IV secretion protein Rhs [Actinomycetota bacterium]